MDHRQFVKYVESHQKPLRRFLVALCCGDSDLADDIAQDTLLKAYLSCDTFNQEKKFSAWIFRIAYNTFVSHYRAHIPASPIEYAHNITGPDNADASFQYQALYAALERLSERERTTILLFYLQGYNIKEISEITEATPDAVKQQLSRGRMHLKKTLGSSHS